MITTKEPKIRSVYKPTDKEYETIRHVYTRRQEMGDKRAEQEKRWDKWQKQWECFRPVKDADDWTSDIYVPITTSIVESMLSEIVNQELIPWVLPRGSEDEPKTVVMNNILEYTWDVAKSNMATFEIVKDALIMGTGIGQEYYWKQERDITLPSGKKQRVTEYEDPYLEPVTLYDFYVDERARGFFGPYSAEDCIRRYIMDYEAFRNFFKGKTWDPMGNSSKVKPGGDTNYYEFYHPPERINHNKEVEVLWYWNKPDDLLGIVANDVMVRMGPNPYGHKQLPFARAIDIKRTHQFYGKGEAELLESLQEETNTLRRMIIDRNHLDIDKPILVSDTLTIEDEDVIARPHGVIPVGDVNAVKFAEYSDIPRSVFSSLELLNDDKIRVTGMDERQQSVSTSGTATEAAILKEATLKRLNMKIWQIKNDFLVDVGRLRVSNILQFYSQPKLEKIVGEKGTAAYEQKVATAGQNGQLVSQGGEDYTASFRNIRIKDKALKLNPSTGSVEEQPARGFTFFEAKPQTFTPINGGFDIRYKATSSMPVSKPLYQQKMVEMYDRLVTNPTVDPWKMAEAVLKSMELDPEEFKFQQQQPQGQSQSDQLQKLVELAGIENEEMLQGKQIGPTAYSSPVHTEIHIEFMKSQKFKDEVPPDSPVLDIFKTHVEGEIEAQMSRGQAQGGTAGGSEEAMMGQGQGGQPTPPQMGMQDVVPGRNMGGGEMPTGMQGSQAGAMVGRKA